MRTTTKLLLLSGLIITLISCQKEIDYSTDNNQGTTGGTGGTGGTGNNTNNIEGDYDFVGMVAHTESTVTASTGGQELKAITISDYLTKNNLGIVKITSNQFMFTDISYSIDTVMNVKTYLDNILFDDSDFPFAIDEPASSSTSPYTRISADSIAVTGAMGVATDPSGATPTGPVGVKLSWSGDTLLLKINTSFTQSISQGGVPGTIVGSVNGITKLKKR